MIHLIVHQPPFPQPAELFHAPGPNPPFAAKMRSATDACTPGEYCPGTPDIPYEPQVDTKIPYPPDVSLKFPPLSGLITHLYQLAVNALLPSDPVDELEGCTAGGSVVVGGTYGRVVGGYVTGGAGGNVVVVVVVVVIVVIVVVVVVGNAG